MLLPGADARTKLLFSPECIFGQKVSSPPPWTASRKAPSLPGLELQGKGGQGKAVNKDRLVVYFVFFKINTLYIKEKGL